MNDFAFTKKGLLHGFSVLRESLLLVKNNKRLMLFLLMPVLLGFLFIVSMALVFKVPKFHHAIGVAHQATFFLIAPLFLLGFFVMYALWVLGGVGLAHETIQVRQGNAVDVKRGLGRARERVKTLVAWLLIGFMVYGFFGFLSYKLPALNSIFNTFWHIITFFVIPLIALENLDIISTIKRSFNLAIKSLGSILTFYIGFMLLSFALMLIFVTIFLPVGLFAAHTLSLVIISFCASVVLVFLITTFLVGSTILYQDNKIVTSDIENKYVKNSDL